MRSGRPFFSFATSSSSGKTSMAPRLMIASCSPKSVISVVSLPTNPQAANLARPAALVINIDDHALEGDVFFGDLELTRQLAQKTLDDVFPLHADHRIQWSAHAEIGDIGRAAGKNPIVSRLHMRVRAVNQRCAAVEIPPHGDLFRGCFSVHIDDDDRRALSLLAENLVDTAKRILHVIGHEDPSLNVDHKRGQIVVAPETPASAGRACWIVGWSNEFFVVIEERINLFFFPDVIT